MLLVLLQFTRTQLNKSDSKLSLFRKHLPELRICWKRAPTKAQILKQFKEQIDVLFLLLVLLFVLFVVFIGDGHQLQL